MFKTFLNTLAQLQKATGKTKYFNFEMSVWNIEGKAVAFLAVRDENGIKAFDRKELAFEETNGRLPKTFFDVEEKLLEYEYRKANFIGEVGDEDENIDYNLNFTFNKAQQRTVRAALSNTFGFGGHNACCIVKKYED